MGCLSSVDVHPIFSSWRNCAFNRLPCRRGLRFGRAEDLDLRDALNMPDEFVFVFLSIHFWPRASAQWLDFGDEHRRTVAGQERVNFRAQQRSIAQRAHALHAGCFSDSGNVRPGRGLTSRTAAAAEKLLVIEDKEVKI